MINTSHLFKKKKKPLNIYMYNIRFCNRISIYKRINIRIRCNIDSSFLK